MAEKKKPNAHQEEVALTTFAEPQYNYKSVVTEYSWMGRKLVVNNFDFDTAIWSDTLVPVDQIIKDALRNRYENGTLGNHCQTKDTNPKDAIGTRKVAMSVVSGPVMMEVALGMLEGACKYGRHNYRDAGVRASVYYDAAMRHLMDWWEGTDIDPDSGLSHITKAITSLVVLRDSMILKKWTDDRPPRIPEGWLQDFNEKAKKILEKYPNPKAAYTQLNTSTPDSNV